ncbi:serine protease [Actinoplanes sp. SE50]|uniref:S1 family peptidase n=1 Tax=unclassified Actinoplanes TaxID=2626549 RepID=UPI00023EBE1E|nr:MULTISPECIES: S1 family peptidase [unclassified Actinoplanes]AEV88073.1 streptogrisin C [Actinoplanes sp. SE50/110]ATO86477.1 serine protease [Actinoplanes sp. SE50]SLM03892.1 serine protease [Actinoplanes sp. SE50/110]
MQRRSIAVAAAVVAATAAAVAFTLPSLAGTTPTGGSGATKASGGVSPELLAAMKRDLGLDANQAATRLKRSKWAGGVTATLAATTGDSYGGAWLASDGTTLKVAVTDAAAARKVKAAGAVPVLVKRSEAQLDAAKGRLDAQVKSAAGLTGWYVDAPTNKLVVVARPGQKAAAQALAKRAGVATDAVTVQVSNRLPKPLFDVRGADPYFISLDGGTARCSIGFSVEGGFVTAGHCGTPGTKTSGFNNQAQGVVKASVFPGNADMGFVEVNGQWTPRPVVNDFKGNELPVGGSTEAPIGAAICRSGSTTGTHCGTILAKNQTVRYPEGSVTGLTRTDVCAEGGDSGGPWLSGDQAQGVTSGGSGDCTAGGETFFQPVNEILAANNLKLLTTGGGDGGGATAAPSDSATAAPSEAPSEAPGGNGDGTANACAGLAVQRQGSLSKAGTAQAQPDGGAFRARAGRHVACLSAPAGSTFDLVLQRLQNGRFKTVAKAAADGTLSVSERSGTFRYVVVATSGTGDYTLGFNVQ